MVREGKPWATIDARSNISTACGPKTLHVAPDMGKRREGVTAYLWMVEDIVLNAH
jgi:hypothetical protein